MLMNLCLATDNNYFDYMIVTITSIIENAEPDDKFNFYILSDKLNKNNKKLLSELYPQCVFYFIDIDLENFKEYQFKQNNHLSVATYLRLFITDFLKDIDKVLYLDCDVIVKRSLSELYNTEFGDNYCAAVEDVGYMYWQKYDERMVHKFHYTNAGILLINLNLWRKNNLKEQFLNYLISGYDTCLFDSDQGVINYVCKDKIKFLDYKWNVQDSFYRDKPEVEANHNKAQILKARNNPTIIHYTGAAKPWNNLFDVKKSEEWHYYNLLLQNKLNKINFDSDSKLKDKLQIYIILSENKSNLIRTLIQLLDISSPIRKFDIKIIGNIYDINIKQYIDKICEIYPNVSLNTSDTLDIIKNSSKDYFWILRDNDKFDFTYWDNVETAITDNKDIICLANDKINFKSTDKEQKEQIFYQLEFLPSAIYKSKLLNDNIINNSSRYNDVLNPIYWLIFDLLNKNINIQLLKKPVVLNAIYCENVSHDSNSISNNFSVFKHICCYLEIIKTLKLRSIFEIFKIYKHKKSFNHYNTKNKEQIFWINYFRARHFQDVIDNFAENNKSKKILIYGNGLISNTIQENYNLSNLNIVAIADNNCANRCKFNIISPNDMNNIDFDIILISVKCYDTIERALKTRYQNKKIYSVLKYI